MSPAAETSAGLIPDPDEFLSFRLFAKKYSSFPEGKLRWERFNQDTNGFGEAGAFTEVNGRVFVHVPSYFAVIRRGHRRAA